MPIASLTREYRHDGSNLRWAVRAYAVQPTDPALGPGSPPWRMIRRTTGEEEFYVNLAHPVFRSATLTELDALLCHLAWSGADITRGQTNAAAFASILADLREKYASLHKLDPVAIKAQADLVFNSIAKAWVKSVDEEDCRSLFNEDLSQRQREVIFERMAVRAVDNPQGVVAEGRFLEFSPAHVVADFVVKHPELFFDGRCWDEAYSEIEYPTQAATEEARSRICRQYEALLLDAVWLTEQEVDDLSVASRERLLRAALALNLLMPTNVEENAANE